jgi:hypothetical protein
LHTPPHPSLSPHAFPAHVGVQPHTPAVPPPPQRNGVLHAPPEQQG